MKYVGCGWLSAMDEWRDSHPKLLADPSKTCHLVLREVAFVHKEYKITFNLHRASSDFRRSRRRATTFAGSGKRVNHFAPTPRCNLKWSNKYGDSRSQEREPVSTLASWIASRTFSLIKNPSLYLDRAALHLNLHPYHSYFLTHRNHTARRSKSGVYA